MLVYNCLFDLSYKRLYIFLPYIIKCVIIAKKNFETNIILLLLFTFLYKYCMNLPTCPTTVIIYLFICLYVLNYYYIIL